MKSCLFYSCSTSTASSSFRIFTFLFGTENQQYCEYDVKKYMSQKVNRWFRADLHVVSWHHTVSIAFMVLQANKTCCCVFWQIGQVTVVLC
jgi:hypothetical protein